MVTHIYGLYRKGDYSDSEAKHLAESLLLSQRIGTTGYIACVSSEGVMVVHPEAEWIGQDINRYDFVKLMRETRHGYIEYDWKNPGETETRPKAMYMTYFEPWDWIIAVSSYRKEFRTLVNIDDFRDSVLSLQFSESADGHIPALDPITAAANGAMKLAPALEVWVKHWLALPAEVRKDVIAAAPDLAWAG